MGQAAVNDTYRETIRCLSDRLVKAQQPIRILDAIKWNDGVQKAFFESGCRQLPQIDTEYYREQNKLGFDPEEKRREFEAIERDAMRQLGRFNALGGILCRMCREYITVVRMLEARGTPDFVELSQHLYGSAHDAFHAGEPDLADLGKLLSDALSNLAQNPLLEQREKTLSAQEAVAILQGRIDHAFAHLPGTMQVRLSDGIIADAAAGADYVKLRHDARFHERELRILEIHEGWVHLGTTYNGMQQPVCTFLSKGPPSSTITQEGLAIFMEIITFASYPDRLRRVTNRITAVEMAENGAHFLEVFGFFREQGDSEEAAYFNASRIFRGSTPNGGPFTKDLTYSKGFVLVYNFIQMAVRQGKLDLLPVLFCGKVTIEDVRTLRGLMDEGIVIPPVFLPPQFRDLDALVAWMCYSNFLGRLNLRQIEADYVNLL